MPTQHIALLPASVQCDKPLAYTYRLTHRTTGNSLNILELKEDILLLFAVITQKNR
jgi:hypothetical protein